MVILVLILANIFAIFWGKYYTLTPILFYAGLAAICAISAWVSIEWQTKNLVVVAVSATLLSLIDEYAHTSVGTLAYFDGYIPSLLTVFGWSIFMVFLVGATKFVSDIRWLQVEDHKKLRTLPVVISLGLIITSTIVQGYLDIFNWVIILVYLLLFTASFYYTSVHELKLNLLMMAISLGFGLSMEYVGGMEGLWTFRFQDPVSLLILFSWPLRLYAVNALCAVAGVDFFSYPEQPVLEPTAEADKKQSLIVVADTHFGLRKENERSDPKAFSDFLNWVKSLEIQGSEKLKAGIWSSNESETITIKQPEKLIFLGDILELWDASDKAIDACTRSIVQSLSGLKAEKIYIFGNHDTELSEILDEYPLGASNLYFKEGEYVTTKGDKKLIFLHGHQFDKLFTLPSWRIMPYINKAGTVFGAYTWIFVAFFAVDISLLISIGFSGIADWLMLLVLGAVSIPFLTIKFARNIWNSLKSTKYKPEGAEKQLAKWWSGFSRKTDSEDWNIVYGHTHVVGFWSQTLGNDSLTLFNLPSWVKDTSQKNGVLFEMVFRNGFLYIDDQSTEFFGWDTDKKRPFLVPKDVIQTRLQNGDANRVGYDVENELQAIGWPQKLIEKWLGYSFENRVLT